MRYLGIALVLGLSFAAQGCASSGSTPMHPLTKGTWKVKRTSL